MIEIPARDDRDTLQETAAEPTALAERVGVLVVHGIGEQRRFEHLEAQTKQIAEALLEREARTGQPTRVTFEIAPAIGGVTYQADQDSWVGGRFPAVRALVRHGADLEHETHLHFHEVWWADANERTTFGKQLRFWGWGLAIWLIPGKSNSPLAGFRGMRLPHFRVRGPLRLSTYNRLQLFGTGVIFLLSSFSLTLAIFLLKRLNFGVWSPVRAFVNYVSGVKLYTQKKRSGGGSLDGIHEAPRFTIRRRMVRALVDMADAEYDRWYILAHSLGSVVAFNGLMTHARSLPNYLDERRWRRLSRRSGWVGPPRRGNNEMIYPDKPEIPPRPLWISDDRVVYRDQLFAKLHGFLTYGSPLDKFAGMWPAYVPINRDEEVFAKGIKWINIFDRTDPVAAALKAYAGLRLSPLNFGFKASSGLLLGHLKYFRLNKGRRQHGRQLTDRVVDWLLLDQFNEEIDRHAGWYEATSWTAFWRTISAYAQWAVVMVVLAFVGVWILRWLFHYLGWSPTFNSWPLWLTLGFLDWSAACGSGHCTGTLATVWALLPWSPKFLELILCSAIVTFFIGLFRYAFVFRQDEGDIQP